jgi:hypothetical protein
MLGMPELITKEIEFAIKIFYSGSSVVNTTSSYAQRKFSEQQNATNSKIKKFTVNTGEIIAKGLQLHLLSWVGAVYFAVIGAPVLLGALLPATLLIPSIVSKLNFTNEKFKNIMTLLDRHITTGIKVMNLAILIVGITFGMACSTGAGFEFMSLMFLSTASQSYDLYKKIYNDEKQSSNQRPIKPLEDLATA